ncbi:restriction endonuclease type II-like protein, partial [Jimgerdemannia flammicorona]
MGWRNQHNPYQKAYKGLLKYPNNINSLNDVKNVTVPSTLPIQRKSRTKHVPIQPEIPIEFNLAIPIIEFNPGDFEIVLILDNREHIKHGNSEYIPSKLRDHGIIVNVRRLALGDVVFIAKHSDGCELVLDTAIERKIFDDLSASITDGRYDEQKFRFQQSNIDTVVYVIEGSLPNDASQTKLLTAMTTLQIVDKYHVQQIANIDETISYLVKLHNQIVSRYK